MKIATLAALAISCFATFAVAQTTAPNPAATPGIDKRQANQQQRIDQGVQSGSVTPREQARLGRGQERIERREARAKEDGVVTRKERAGIQHAQNVESRRIARQKHDRQRVSK